MLTKCDLRNNNFAGIKHETIINIFKILVNYILFYICSVMNHTFIWTFILTHIFKYMPPAPYFHATYM